MTDQRRRSLIESLSPDQRKIISAREQFVVVAAGPGSGKTRVLVHKLAHMLLEEDVKPERLLMLTFSRAAAVEFKTRLVALYGPGAYGVDVKTFHSYAFDLLGRTASSRDKEKDEEKMKTVVTTAVKAIREGRVESAKIDKTVLVIDEAQDMGEAEFALVEALIDENETMRVIAVGDDDQNIYAFRESDSKYMRQLLDEDRRYAARHAAELNARSGRALGAAVLLTLLVNFRSARAVVEACNRFARTITQRIKDDACVSHSQASGDVAVRDLRRAGDPTASAVAVVVESIRSAGVHGRRRSYAVLARTNEEVGLAYGALIEAGVPATFIQNLDGVRIEQLFEVQSFIVSVRRTVGDAVKISDTQWAELREHFRVKFEKSPWRRNVETLLDAFEAETDPGARYLSDLQRYFEETTVEDSFGAEQGRVILSTFHKAKGREFDEVLLVSRMAPRTDDDRRACYVAMSRARERLVIHDATGYFATFFADDAGVSTCVPTVNYPSIGTRMVPVGWRDVNLGDFKGRKQALCLGARPGTVLSSVNMKGFSVADAWFRWSHKFASELAGYSAKGWRVVKAEVNFLVRWEESQTDSFVARASTTDKQVHAVVLPMLTLVREKRAAAP